MAEREWADKNYYADLGVSSSADHAEIRKAYRKIARENHPDKKPGDTAAEERFKKAAEAYDVLGDDKKRKEYDEFRDMLKSGGFGGSGFPGGFRSSGGQTGGFNVEDLFGGATTGGGSASAGGFSDIFGSFFDREGGTRTSTRSTRTAKPSRGPDVEAEIDLPFRDAAKGTTLPLQISGEAPCTTCHGSGSRSGAPVTCTTCQGSGFTSKNRGAFGFSAPCPDCGATGEIIEDPCPACDGSGTVHRTRSITVRIPAGVVDGQKVRLAGQGEAGPNGRPSGDLFVTVHVTPDKIFTRQGDNLQVTLPVSFAELVLGDTVSVPTLDEPVRMKVPAGSKDGRVLRVRGKGIKNGDLLVTLRVEVPTDLDPAATSALRAYAQAEKDSGFDPRAGWPGVK